ncbi:MAG: WYL domain-containing transcriptional regulator [Balneola sp.]
MPKNKDAYSRYRIIDQILRQRPFVKTSELAEICAERLGLDSISGSTIQKDIRDLREDTVLQIYAPIQYSHSEKAHYYPDDVDEIFPAIELSDQEISALLFYGKVQNQYRQYGIFSDIIEAIDKVLEAANVRKQYRKISIDRPLVQTEKIPPLKGSELLIKIIQGMKSEKKIRFEYHKFASEKKERIISPYLLKEDKHMWYLIGLLEGKDQVTTFAVDRMSNVRIVNESMKRINFNPKNHFKHSLGITVPIENPIEITLSFTPFQGNYLKSLPIHESQKIILDDDKEFQVSLLVHPTYEFYSKILGYGNSVKVISPEAAKEEIKKRLVEALDHY